jgi:hypothetical protein
MLTRSIGPQRTCSESMRSNRYSKKVPAHTPGSTGEIRLLNSHRSYSSRCAVAGAFKIGSRQYPNRLCEDQR